MAKPVKRVDLSRLNAEQRAALTQFVKDCQAAAPHIQEMKDAAQSVFAHLVKSQQWGIAEGEAPDGKPRQNLWHVGAPEVNYVDHIERP